MFMRGIRNHHIDDEPPKDYYDRVHNDNNNAVLDTITGGYYDECTYVDIGEKLEKISRKTKAWSTTFTVKATQNSTTDEICENME